MKMKRLLGLFLVIALVIALTPGGAPAANVVTFRLGHTTAPTHHYHYVSLMFAEKIAERTNGRIEILVFPSDQLGTQMESIEGTMLGTQDMVLTSDMALSNWIPEMGIFNLPFIFRDAAHFRTVLNGPIAERISDKMGPTGAQVLAWWDGGLRHVTNSVRPIVTPEDLSGLVIRVPEGAVYLETFSALGAIPTVLGLGEVYSALQLGTVDGQENPPAHILSQRFYEVQPFVSRTGHIRFSSPLLVNSARFAALPQELQDIMRETAREIGVIHDALVQELEEEQWAQLAALGMEIYDPDLEPFRAAAEPVFDLFKQRLDPDLIEAVRTAR